MGIEAGDKEGERRAREIQETSRRADEYRKERGELTDKEKFIQRRERKETRYTAAGAILMAPILMFALMFITLLLVGIAGLFTPVTADGVEESAGGLILVVNGSLAIIGARYLHAREQRKHGR